MRGSREQGMSLVEMLVMLFLAGVLLLIAGSHSITMLSAGDAHSALHKVSTLMQQARIQAIARNHACRFQIDGVTGRVQVLDLNDPMDSSDDITLFDVALSSKVSFSSPEPGPAITMASFAGTTYGADFASDGSVSQGEGTIHVLGGDVYHRLTLFAAGGSKLERWADASWRPAS